MSHRNSIAFLVFALASAGAPATAAADGFALVCNASSAPHELGKADVRALYTGKSKTLGNAAVTVVVRGEDDAVFGQFVDQIFAIPTRTLLSKIKQEVFKGEMIKPVKAASDDDVVQAVGATPGMIGVISAQAAGHLPKTVAVIAIGG